VDPFAGQVALCFGRPGTFSAAGVPVLPKRVRDLSSAKRLFCIGIRPSSGLKYADLTLLPDQNLERALNPFGAMHLKFSLSVLHNQAVPQVDATESWWYALMLEIAGGL
jgi:hypothetical protein